MLWREKVRAEVESILSDWNSRRQVLHQGDIRTLAFHVADHISTPDAPEQSAPAIPKCWKCGAPEGGHCQDGGSIHYCSRHDTPQS